MVSFVSKHKFFIWVLINVSSTNSPSVLSSVETATAVEAVPIAACGVQLENSKNNKNKIFNLNKTFILLPMFNNINNIANLHNFIIDSYFQ